MSGVVGADVGRLRELGGRFSTARSRLEFVRQALDTLVDQVVWQGNDSAQFSDTWRSQHRELLGRAITALETNAVRLAANADAQESASEADGEGGGPLLSPAGATPALGAGPASAAGTPELADLLAGTPAMGLSSAPATNAIPPGAREFLDGLVKTTPEAINAAWEELSDADRAWLLANRPFKMGNLDGIPFTDRDTANRSELDRLLGQVDAEMDKLREQNPDHHDEILRDFAYKNAGLDEEEYLALLNLQAQLGKYDDTQLVALDLKHEGATRAAVSIGNLDEASHVGVFVPGISSRISNTNQFNGYMTNMAALRKETGEILGKVGGGIDDVAQVYWLDYSAPAGVEPLHEAWRAAPALDTNRAEDGGDSLAGFGNGLGAVNPTSHNTLQGHSYGSVTSNYGLARTEAFDSFVAFGSPGLSEHAEVDPGTQTPAVPHGGLLGGGGIHYGGRETAGESLDIKVADDHRYYGHAPGDFVVASGAHGPSGEDWGFVRLPTHAVDGFTASKGHSEYLDPGSSFQRALAAITANRPDQIPGRT